MVEGAAPYRRDPMPARLLFALLLASSLAACGGEEKGGGGSGEGAGPATGHGSATGSGGGRRDGSGGRTGGGDGAGGQAFAIDQGTPRSLVEGIFQAAQKGDLQALTVVAAPQGADGDVRDIAAIAKAEPEHQTRFREAFGKGRISGEIEEQGDTARVPILFGPDGADEETFELVRVDGKWYLKGF
jgi:hypothetical protein